MGIMLMRAIRDCYTANDEYRKAGEEFDYKGPKNENLVPVKKAQADALENEAKAEEQ
jgi:hypothetical protein